MPLTPSPFMSVPTLPDTDPEPAWFRWLSRLVLQLGPWRATLAMTLVVMVLSVALAEGVILALGRGNPLIAAFIATLCALVLTPLVGSFVLRLVFELDQTRQRLTVL